jgi:DNA-binding transcriptional MerR regulator
MTLSRVPVWTLDELSARVALSLSVGYEGQASGRVREVPDRRTIRYYTTLGLLDRPTLRGRTALYSRRHLAQLVAIKRLQARGLSLAEAQARLLGLADRKLAELAQLPAGGEDAPPAEEPAEAGRRGQAFWAAAPGPAAAAVEPAPRALTGVALAEGVTLLLDAGRAPDEHDLEAVRAAAAPLLRLLRARRLLAARHGSATKGETP